jgi:hypothetical protein
MSALPPKADIETRSRNVRFVPNQTFCAAAKNFSLGPELKFGVAAERKLFRTRRRLRRIRLARLAPGISTNHRHPATPIGSIDLDPSDLTGLNTMFTLCSKSPGASSPI